nr:DUF5615 family PIN-like protein [Candidatus Baldrarchaeota archaeon]
MAKLLVDENIPLSVMKWLQEEGHDVVRVSQVGLKGEKDEVIIDFARKERRIILTLDLDFGCMYYFSRDFAVIVVRVKPPTPQNILSWLRKAFKKIDLDKLDKGLIIISKKVRIIT